MKFEFLKSSFTPPNSEIICGQNVGTKVVCGIIFIFEKKAMPKIFELGGVPSIRDINSRFYCIDKIWLLMDLIYSSIKSDS
jgi:hypothetical protein